MKKLMPVLVSLYAYLQVVFTPIVPTLLWLGFFIMVDLCTGMWKANRAGEAITSRRMSQTGSKTLLYFILIICAHVLDTQFVMPAWMPAKIAQLVAGYFAVVEFKSISENAGALLGQPVLSYLKSLLTRKQ